MLSSASALELRIREWIVQHTGQDTNSITGQMAIWECGLDSLAAIELAEDLEAFLGVEVSPAIAWEYPTIAELVQHLGQLQVDKTEQVNGIY